MAFDDDLQIRMFSEELRVSLRNLLVRRADVVLVVVEVNVLDILGEEIRNARTRLRDGVGGTVTVTRAEASALPPAPLAIR